MANQDSAAGESEPNCARHTIGAGSEGTLACRRESGLLPLALRAALCSCVSSRLQNVLDARPVWRCRCPLWRVHLAAPLRHHYGRGGLGCAPERADTERPPQSGPCTPTPAPHWAESGNFKGDRGTICEFLCQTHFTAFIFVRVHYVVVSMPKLETGVSPRLLRNTGGVFVPDFLL